MHDKHPNPTIKQRVLEVLADWEWHALSEFLRKGLYTSRNRIAECNAEWRDSDAPWRIISEKVEGSNTFKYRLTTEECEKVKFGGGYSWKIKT